MLVISVLGPLQVHRDDHLLPVPSGKPTELLVRLALDAGVVVSAERLLDDLWGDDAVHTRRNTLQAKVARLRRALGDPDVVEHASGGYRLAVTPTQVDALARLTRVDEAERRVHDGDDLGALAHCEAVADGWPSDLVPDAGDAAWVATHRARLEAARRRAAEIHGSALLRAGRPRDAIHAMEHAILADPWHEALWVVRITALYRAGRQHDALAAYQDIRRRLADELGLEPGPQLRHVEQQVLLQHPSLDAPPAATPGSAGTDGTVAGPAPAGNLPALTTELVGRTADLAAVDELLHAHRLVEIIGPGGVGKTALALAVARDIAHTVSRVAPPADGVWLARLEGSTTEDEVVDGIIAALQVPGGESVLLDRVRATEMLLVLDNCEHVRDAAAAIATRLLDAAPRLRILCTSQVALDVEGEAILVLDPLPLDDAVELFRRRATDRRRAGAPATDDAIEGLCRALDGLPLAIELAAARTRTLPIDEIVRRLDDRFDVLHDPASRRPERRRALKATIAWSYELLFPDDQRGLWALATFAGGASLTAIEHVLAAIDVPARTAIDVIGRLAGRSLLIVDDTPSGLRYRLLDSIRAFALDALVAAGSSDTAHAAHAAWFAALARESTAGVRSARQHEFLEVARVERANIDAALHWCARHDSLLGLEMVNGFGWAWLVLGDSRGAQRTLTARAAAGDEAPPRARAAALLTVGWIEASTGELARAHAHVDAALAIATAIDDPELVARGLCYSAYVVSHDGDFRGGLERTGRSRALYEQLDFPWDLAMNSLFATRAAISAADEARALDTAAHARDAVGAIDDPWLHVRYEAMLGELARLQHRFDDAVEHLRRATATSGRLGFLQTEAYQVSCLGRAECQAGDYERGAATLQLAVQKAEATGDLRMAALARVHLGRVRRALGDTAGARDALERAAEWHARVGGGEQAVLGDALLAALDAGGGAAGAEARLTAALAAARAADNAPAEVFALDALARLARRAGDPAAARRHATQADARMDAVSHFIAARDRVDAHAVARDGAGAGSVSPAP